MQVCTCLRKNRKGTGSPCTRCGLSLLSKQEYQYVRESRESRGSPLEPPPTSVDVYKVMVYLAHKIQKGATSTKVHDLYTSLVRNTTHAARLIHDLIVSTATKVLHITLAVLSNLSDYARYNIAVQVLQCTTFEVGVILLVIDGLVLVGRYLWDLYTMSEKDPSSNLFRAMVHRVNKSTLAERFVADVGYTDHLNVLMDESTVLEVKLIQAHLRKVYFSGVKCRSGSC